MTGRVGPQMTAVLDDRILPGEGEVNGIGDLLMKLLCGGGLWG